MSDKTPGCSEIYALVDKDNHLFTHYKRDFPMTVMVEDDYSKVSFEIKKKE